MSFLDLFRQPKPIVKPYRCLSCRGRFKLKAHAANHQRQAGNQRCRELGFEHAEEKAPVVFKVIKIYFAGSILSGSQASKFLPRGKLQLAGSQASEKGGGVRSKSDPPSAENRVQSMSQKYMK